MGINDRMVGDLRNTGRVCRRSAACTPHPFTRDALRLSRCVAGQACIPAPEALFEHHGAGQALIPAPETPFGRHGAGPAPVAYRVSRIAYRVSHIPHRAFLLCLVLALAAGCSGGDSWYDKARDAQQEKAEYIEAQVQGGIDPEEARREYELNEMIRNTEGREP